MKSSNALVWLVLLQMGAGANPAFARAGVSTLAPPAPPVAPAEAAPPETPERSLKKTPPKKRAKKIVATPAGEPGAFSGRFSTICNQLLSLPVAIENGVRSDGYEVATDLAVPREQVARLLDMGPAESFRTRILAKFRALLGRADTPRTELDVVIPDIGRPEIDLETKRGLKQVGQRLAELQSDSYRKPNSHYLMRHALHSRDRIDNYLARLIAGARQADEALVALRAQTPANRAEAPVAVPAMDLAPVETALEPTPVPVNPDYVFPFNVDWSNVKSWSKQLGLAAAAGAGVAFMVQQDPRWILGTMLSVGAGVFFASAPLKDRLGQFKGWVKAALDRRPPPETSEEALARRLERTRVQEAVLEKVRARMSSGNPEYGLSYYSFVAEASVPHALTQPVVPIGVPPRPQPPARVKLVRVEIVTYTNLNAHRMLTFVTDLDEPVGAFTELSLVHQ